MIKKRKQQQDEEDQASEEELVTKTEQSNLIDSENKALNQAEDKKMSLPKQEEDKQENVKTTSNEESRVDVFEMVKSRSDMQDDDAKKETELSTSMMKSRLRKKKWKLRRQRTAQKLQMNMQYVGMNVVMPEYVFDDKLKIYREVTLPLEGVFLPIGYDPQHTSKQKHYRRLCDKELENEPKFMPNSPFQTYPILRGQSRGNSKSWFGKNETDRSGQVSTVKNMGMFKGIVSVINKLREQNYLTVRSTRLENLKQSLNELSEKILGQPFEFDYEDLITAEGRELFQAKLRQIACDDLKLLKHFCKMNYSQKLERTMMLHTPCVIRVYVLDADELPEKDVGGSVDPYIVVKLNGKVYNERDSYIPDCHNPEINKMFEFNSGFPGCGILEIQMWDRDTVFGDDFIGETRVDLEDRFFSPEWQSIKNKPIEPRQLYHKSTKASQGVLKTWIEIIPIEAMNKNNKPWNITPRPPEDFEIRLVIWETKDVKIMDFEGTSDIYCRAFFDSNHSKRTETHFRSMNGNGSFNYRLHFDVQNPGDNQILNLQVWDMDLLSSNDFIGDSSLNLASPIKDAMMTNKAISINRKYYEAFLRDNMEGNELEFEDDNSFWIEMKDKNGNVNGKMRVQIDTIPKKLADSYRNAEGRAEPNHSPFLPPPIGRMQWSLNPFAMLTQIMSPEFIARILCDGCLIICLIIGILSLPFLVPRLFAGILHD